MKIFVHAYTLRIGGGESIGLGFINALYTIPSEDEFHILVPKKPSYQHFQSTGKLHIYPVPSFFTRSLFGRLLSIGYLLYRIHQIKPDVIFSMGNYGIPVRCKQLVLLHWPYAVYPDSIAWQQMPFLDFLKRKLRAFFVRQKLRYASALTVQTALMKTRVLQHLPFKGAVHVIASSISLNSPHASEAASTALDKLQAIRNLHPEDRLVLFVSVYYSHKNLEVLIPLARKFQQQGDPFRLLISLDPTQNKAVPVLLEQIKQEGLEDRILNLGTISRQELREVYGNSDLFILPTLLESYGLTYFEAMSSGIPIFTSDLDFAHEACGEAAFYFDPLNHESIYKSIITAHQAPEEVAEKVKRGKEKAAQLLSWEEIVLQYLYVLKNL